MSETMQVAEAHKTIRAIHVLRSGTAEQHREHRFGSWKLQLLWLLTSRSWVPLPLHYFLIAHRDGLVLFDTGIDPAIATDPDYISQWIGRVLLRRIFRLHVTEDDRLDRCLTREGFAAGDIRIAVISHLHFDHVGGIAHIPQARLLVSEGEWAQLSAPQPEREWILREHIELPGAQWEPFQFAPTDDPALADFAGVYDVAGDGTMVLLPTPGHTPGSISMLIRQPGWTPVLLAADVAYEAGSIDDDRVPGTGDAAVLRATYARIRRLRERLGDLTIIPSHDFGAAEAIAGAMKGAPAG